MFCSTPISAAKAKFGAIDIAGLPPAESADLQHRLTTLLARIRGAAIREGKTYNRIHAEQGDRTIIQSRLQKDGFLAAQVKLEGAEYHADTNRADIHFSVKPGAKTHVQIAGAHLWPWTKRSLLPEYQGVGVDEETVQEGQQALISHFQAQGLLRRESHVRHDRRREAAHRRLSRHQREETQSHRCSIYRSNRK